MKRRITSQERSGMRRMRMRMRMRKKRAERDRKGGDQKRTEG